jgi:hypothetical protein
MLVELIERYNKGEHGSIAFWWEKSMLGLEMLNLP